MKNVRTLFFFLFVTLLLVGEMVPGTRAMAGRYEAPQEVPLLTGPVTACVNAAGNVYTTDQGMSGYVWTVVGGNITAGGNSTSYTCTVTWTAAGSKSISVTYLGAGATTTLPVTVNATTASVSISATSTSVSTGTPVTFTATPVNGGATPTFQWRVNNLIVGTNSATYTYTPLNGDIVFCYLYSSSSCVNPATPYLSNLITMTVSSQPLVVSLPAKTAVSGQKLIFPVKLTGAGAAGTPIGACTIEITYNPAVLQFDGVYNFYTGMPQAQWYVNGGTTTLTANWQHPTLGTVAVPDNSSLFEIRFNYLGGPATLPFTIYDFTDINGDLVTTTPVNGSVTPLSPVAAYVAGDFHQHTTYTDGSYSFGYVMGKNNFYGLNWWANSEHGGGFTAWGKKSGTDLGTTVYFADSVPNPIIGTVSTSGGKQVMWRWQSLRDFAFADVLNARSQYNDKMILQSYELNVPGHEHASLGLINNQFTATPDCNPLAEFEFKFDNSDADLLGGPLQGWTKSALSGHAKAVEAATWLQTNYPNTSYLVFAHPERKSLNNIQSFRDMNNAAPSVCIGFESMPGHQKATNRGEYGGSNTTVGGSTFGGCGIYAAKIGGLWDALLSEGRHWWLFASSDFHSTSADFYPGEYEKNYTYVTNRNQAQSYIDGLRSGNNYVVEGDLIDSLDFKVGTTPAMTTYATMGGIVTTTNTNVTVKIKVHDPVGTNNNTYDTYNNPSVDHIDLIRGAVTGIVPPSSPNYSVDQVTTTAVIARFDAAGGVSSPDGIVSQAWTDLGNGWKEITYTYNNLVDSVYFRLRGTNQGLGVANETDANGNPLSDLLMGSNNATRAFADLWFYSNPIFVAGPVSPSLSGPTTACQGSAGNVYTTDASQTNYAWTVTGGTITAGGNASDNTATVTWNTPGAQSISVSYTGSAVTTLPVTVNQQLAASVAIQASANNICAGTSVTFTATLTNGGSAPAYQWKKNGSGISAATNATYTYTPANNDAISCVMTSNAACVTGSPATSGIITMVVNATTASISIAASANPSIIGNPVTFTATPVNGGPTPTFEWRVNNVQVGTSSPSYTYTPNNGDVIYCYLKSSAPCVNPGAIYLSNLITMTVNYPTPNLLVTLPNKTAMPGDIIYFPVKLKGASNNGTPITAATIQVTYDPAVVQYGGLFNFYSGMPEPQYFYYGDNDTVTANWQQPSLLTVAVPDSTTLFEIKFTYLGGTGNVNYSVAEFTDSYFNLILANKTNGSVTSTVPATRTVQNATLQNGQTACYDAIQTITVAGGGTNFIVNNGGSATFVAGQSIGFMPGVTVNSGGYLWGHITTSNSFCGAQAAPITAAVKEEAITDVPLSASAASRLRAYPNPTSGMVTLDLSGTDGNSMTKAEIYTVSGMKISSLGLENSRKHEIGLSGLVPGIYFIHVITQSGSEVVKVIKY